MNRLNLLPTGNRAIIRCHPSKKAEQNMVKFTIPLDENGNVLSPVGEVLASRRIELINEDDFIHPCRALSNGWSKLERSLQRAAETLLESDFYTSKEEGATHGLLNAFEDLCYTATELFDVYAHHIPKAINLRPDRTFKASEEAYKNVVKNRRSEWSSNLQSAQAQP